MRDIFKILEPKYKLRFSYLIIMMLIASLLEMFGISLIIPIMLSLSNQDIFLQYPFLNNINQFLNYPTNAELIVISVTLLGAVYIIKNIYMLVFYYIESHFLAGLLEKISQNLYNTYITQSYEYFIKINTSNLITRFRSDLPMFRSSLLAFSTIFTEGLILLGIVSFLALYNPQVFLVVFSLVLFFSIIFFLFFKKQFRYLGNEKQTVETIRSKSLQESFGAIKEIKISNLENIFSTSYKVVSDKLKFNFARLNFLTALPRIFFESLAIIILVSIIYFIFYFTNLTINNVLPLIGVFSAAAFKFLPSANRLISAFNRIRYGNKSTKMILSDLKLKKKIDAEHIKKFEYIELKNLNFKYDDKQIFNDLNFRIAANDKIFIYGDTGSGKSTLIDIILGLKKPVSGDIFINKKNYSKSNFTLSGILGYVPQSVFLFDDSIKNNITLYKHDVSNQKIDISIKISKLESFLSSLEEKEDSLVGQNGIKLSGGQKQRIGIAREIHKKPEVFIFDESTNSLDKNTEKEFMTDFLNYSKNKTVIMVSHNLNLKKFFNKVFKIEEGQIKEVKDN